MNKRPDSQQDAYHDEHRASKTQTPGIVINGQKPMLHV